MCTLLNAKYPVSHISQTTVSKIVYKIEEHGTVKQNDHTACNVCEEQRLSKKYILLNNF